MCFNFTYLYKNWCSIISSTWNCHFFEWILYIRKLQNNFLLESGEMSNFSLKSTLLKRTNLCCFDQHITKNNCAQNQAASVHSFLHLYKKFLLVSQVWVVSKIWKRSSLGTLFFYFWENFRSFWLHTSLFLWICCHSRNDLKSVQFHQNIKLLTLT